MLLYAFRRLNLFIITLLFLTMIGFGLVRLDPESHWALESFWAGWPSYLQELLQFNFESAKQETRLPMSLLSSFLQHWSCVSSHSLYPC